MTPYAASMAHQCTSCDQTFGSAQALGGHRGSCARKNAIREASGDDAAAAIARAVGGASFEAPQVATTHKPALVIKGDQSSNGDRPPRVLPAKLDELSKRLGATQFNAGTNRFDWCREAGIGPRHTFSRMYWEQRVLVDVYAERTRGVVKEIEEKRAILETRNASIPREERWGYIPWIKREDVPGDDAVAIALDGGVAPLAPAPVYA